MIVNKSMKRIFCAKIAKKLCAGLPKWNPPPPPPVEIHGPSLSILLLFDSDIEDFSPSFYESSGESNSESNISQIESKQPKSKTVSLEKIQRWIGCVGTHVPMSVLKHGFVPNYGIFP